MVSTTKLAAIFAKEAGVSTPKVTEVSRSALGPGLAGEYGLGQKIRVLKSLSSKRKETVLAHEVGHHVSELADENFTGEDERPRAAWVKDYLKGIDTGRLTKFHEEALAEAVGFQLRKRTLKAKVTGSDLWNTSSYLMETRERMVERKRKLAEVGLGRPMRSKFKVPKSLVKVEDFTDALFRNPDLLSTFSGKGWDDKPVKAKKKATKKSSTGRVKAHRRGKKIVKAHTRKKRT